jgi:hypothetical protein
MYCVFWLSQRSVLINITYLIVPTYIGRLFFNSSACFFACFFLLLHYQFLFSFFYVSVRIGSYRIVRMCFQNDFMPHHITPVTYTYTYR